MASPPRIRGGTLTDVEDQLAKKTRVAPEMAPELRAITIRDLAELRRTRGDRAGNRGPRAVILAGSYDPRDGGEGVFIWHDTSTTADNAGQGAAGVVEVAGVEVGRWIRSAMAAEPIGFRVITSGTSYTPTTGTTSIVIELWGGGGAGGGTAATAAGTCAAGGGGGSGGYLRKRIGSVGAGPFTVAIGAGGTGVSGSNGNAGGATTFNDGSTTYTAQGGGGGFVGGAGGPGLQFTQGGAGAAVSVNGDVNAYGATGKWGLIIGTAAGVAGDGAPTALGGNGAGNIFSGTTSNGAAAQANTGSGGAGSNAGNSATTRAGGAGGSGLITVLEFG